MKNNFSRGDFVRSGAVAGAALAASGGFFAAAAGRAAADEGSAIRLGVASYTFREFSRAQMIGFLKQLNVLGLNAKDVKDHLPMEPQEEATALADYVAAGIKLPAAGTIYFQKKEDAGIRSKIAYCKRAGIGVICVGEPGLEDFARQ